VRTSAVAIATVTVAIPFAVRTRYAARTVPIVVVPCSPGRVPSQVEIVHSTSQISSTSSTVVWSPHVAGNRRRLSEPPVLLRMLLLVDKDDHPDPYASALTQERCAMYPTRSSLFI
jgi:hypothetical protein